jgi:hypothetical protein
MPPPFLPGAFSTGICPPLLSRSFPYSTRSNEVSVNSPSINGDLTLLENSALFEKLSLADMVAYVLFHCCASLPEYSSYVRTLAVTGSMFHVSHTNISDDRGFSQLQTHQSPFFNVQRSCWAIHLLVVDELFPYQSELTENDSIAVHSHFVTSTLPFTIRPTCHQLQ